MLYHLFKPLEDVISGFRLFEYISFRAAFAAILAFLVATVVGPGIVSGSVSVGGSIEFYPSIDMDMSIVGSTVTSFESSIPSLAR